jgi:hypothetical protein
MNARIALLIAASFAGGILVSRVALPSQAAAASTRVYELRTYTTYPGRLEVLKARFRDHTTKLFERHGMKNVGYWVPMDAPKSENTLVYVLSFDSRDAAKKAWDDFHNDPEWKTVQADSEKDGKIVEKVESTFMSPTDFSALQ